MMDKYDDRAAIAGEAAGLTSTQWPGLALLLRQSASEEREACAKIAEHQIKVFSSIEYATNQSMSSIGERFACKAVAEEIRKRSET